MAGCVHLYCGDGKGKTTAAVGLAVRAAGSGRRVLITRFLKTEASGEVAALRSIPGITVTPCEKSFGFFNQMSEEKKEQAREYYSGLLEETLVQVREKSPSFCLEKAEKTVDVLILDEIMAVCNYGLIDEAVLLSFLESRPEELEVVLTGREPSEALLELSDYVTEMKKIKHPYETGIMAREGIEY